MIPETDVPTLLALLAEEGVLPLVHHAGWRSLSELVAGERVSGGWWGHPAGKAIFAAATALEAHPDTLTTRLVAGKITFIHRSRFAAFVRVALDEERRSEALASLSPVALGLLARVRQGPVRLDEDYAETSRGGLSRKQLSAAATDLERRLLVVSTQIHTERGAHTRRIQRLDDWVTGDLAAAAAALTLAGAQAQLRGRSTV